jgi:hypothetical protein
VPSRVRSVLSTMVPVASTGWARSDMFRATTVRSPRA